MADKKDCRPQHTTVDLPLEDLPGGDARICKLKEGDENKSGNVRNSSVGMEMGERQGDEEDEGEGVRENAHLNPADAAPDAAATVATGAKSAASNPKKEKSGAKQRKRANKDAKVQERRVQENDEKGPGNPTEEQMEAFRQKVIATQKQRPNAVGEFVVHDSLPPPDSRFFRLVNRSQNKVYSCWGRHQRMAKRVLLVAVLIAYFVYLGFAIHFSVDGAAALITCTVLGTIYFLQTKVCKKQCTRCQQFTARTMMRLKEGKPALIIKWSTLSLVGLGVVLFLVLDVGADRGRLTSAAGVFIFIILGFVTSKDPARIQWQPVIWGLGLQITLGVIILRWSKGYLAFKFLGELVRGFLEYTDEGSKFVFGEQGLILHPVAFKVFPIVIFFSSVIAIMYYWGIMQMIVCRIAWLMQFTMGTTAIESLNAATNIFIGMAESVVVVAPYMNKLTKSELHAVMTGGFATVAGSYMAVLIQVGASPEHLLSAAIMSAPAALAMAKLSYPETEVSLTKTEEDVYIESSQERNVVEAAARGAMGAIAVVASILVNLIAFIALMAFLDAILSYAGARVGYPELSFQIICSYILWPLAAIMGVEIEDAGKVARLLGVKVFVDEFISFRDLGIMVKAGTIADRSVVIATYACCGFGSVAAVGTYVGALAAVAPDRRGDISELAFRAAVNGNVAGFLTACIAGVLYKGDMNMVALPMPDILEIGMNSTFSMTTAAEYLTL